MQAGFDITTIAIIGSVLGALISVISTLISFFYKRHDVTKSVKLSIKTPSGAKKEIVIDRTNPSDLQKAHRILEEVVNEQTDVQPQARPHALN